MENLTINQWLEKEPYLKKMAEYTIFTTKDDLHFLKKSETINVGGVGISTEFLKRILNNNQYYEYAYNYFTNKKPDLKISYIIAGDIGMQLSYKKTHIIKGIDILVSSNQISLNQKQQQKYDTLKNNITFEKFLKTTKDSLYNIDIEGNQYSIPIDQIIFIMQLPEEKFNKICHNNKVINIYGIPKNYFIYACLTYFEKNNIFDNFLIPKTIINRFEEIKLLQKIDIQAVNCHLNTTDTKFKEIKINEELEKKIIDGIPENANNLKKAIYIYIKMCKTLTYDDEYYAVNQQGIATKKHKNIDYISTITPTNNKIVCFEFNLIYSKFLNDLGIKFSSDYKGMMGEEYGQGHANLEFRSDKFLVRADSVISILQGDLMKAKLNQPLVGFKCINANETTQNEFKKTVAKVYELIAQQEKSKKEASAIQTLDELIGQYTKITTNKKKITLYEKLAILIEKVNETKMVGVDSLAYVLQLRKILFNDQERRNNININIIRNNNISSKNKIATANAIFTLNYQNYEENQDQNIYYYYNPNHQLVSISKEELQTNFDKKIFEYISKEHPQIPGITETRGVKK